MIDTKPYLDQLDILSTYMKYWIEFKDKERVRNSKLPKEATPVGITFLIDSEQIEGKRNLVPLNLNKVMKGNYSEYVLEEQKPYRFSDAIKTFNELKRPKYRNNKITPKQAIINSMQKFV